MRDANVFGFKRVLPRMSWSPRNLYNLWRRSLGEKVSETDYTRTTKTLFQQRWAAKQLVRAYHGDYINEKIFKRWYLPETLPDVRPRKSLLDDTLILNKWANRNDALERAKKKKEEEALKGLPPVGSLMFSEIERRIDVIIFRSCFAHSIYEARRLVIHGDVLLNGKQHQNANTRLAPGDMVSVDPKAIRFIQAKAEVIDKNEVNHKDEIATKVEDSSTTDPEVKTSPDEPISDITTPSSTRKNPKSDLTPFHLPEYASPFIFVPAYLEVSFSTCSTIYLRHPNARPGYSEIPTPYDADGEVIRLAWEWYSKVRPRVRSKTQLARMPENRQ